MGVLPDKLDRGKPYPLGATWDGLSVNFAVYSGNATRVDLCLFDASGRRETARYTLPECTDEVFHGSLANAEPGLQYGYRVYGPYKPEEGLRFNPNKLVLDPYAKALAGQVRWTDALFGYRVASARGDLTFDRRDSAPAMVKGVVVNDNFSWAEDRRPMVPWSDTIIYEAHTKGLTQLIEDVRPPVRGTFAALTHPKVLDHLKRLGVTAVELLPVHAFLQDRSLLEKGLSNYWGYNTLSFFSPEPRYLSRDNTNELRMMVRRLHAAGLEVILDVVYNHTCEGSELGPTLSWRGLDNSSYYRLAANRRHCINDTGTGNTVNMSNARVLQMVMDSLRYWVTSYGIDGFRFDLGVTLGREDYGFDPGSGFFDALRQDPILSHIKLISEPWDIGPGGYQLGHHPPGFAEWNDRFRDDVRRFWRGDSGTRSELSARLAGSGDIFDRRARRPWASINYVASHDGLTLEDVVSYEQRHNEGNGENNNDGHGDNLSRNWGTEGSTDDRAILDTRARVKRAMLTTVFTSLGTPMLLAGDEFGRTQMGNNNAYCQDNEISWVDWSRLDTAEGADLSAFVTRLAAIRRQYTALRAEAFLYSHDELLPGIRDVDWFDERGLPLKPVDWDNPEGRALCMRRAVEKDDGAVELVTVIFNGSQQPIVFKMPGAFTWSLILDSAAPILDTLPIDGSYPLEGHSAAILVAEVAGKP